MLGETHNLISTSSGHYAIPLTQSNNSDIQTTQNHVSLICKYDDISNDPKKYAEMAKKHSDMSSIVELFNQWETLNSDCSSFIRKFLLNAVPKFTSWIHSRLSAFMYNSSK